MRMHKKRAAVSAKTTTRATIRPSTKTKIIIQQKPNICKGVAGFDG